MRPTFIIVEGPTEKLFVDECLAPYLRKTHDAPEWEIAATVLGRPGSKGGRVAFSRVKTDVTLLLKQRANAVVSMLVDYYGMKTDFPDFERCQIQNNTTQRIDCLELALNGAINSRRFSAYFQQYEFEAMLFAVGKPLTTYLKEATCHAIAATRATVATPEEINTNAPPSYRLIEIFNDHEGVGYRKTFHGPILALELGMEVMLKECPRFANWVRSLAQLAQVP